MGSSRHRRAVSFLIWGQHPVGLEVNCHQSTGLAFNSPLFVLLDRVRSLVGCWRHFALSQCPRYTNSHLPSKIFPVITATHDALPTTYKASRLPPIARCIITRALISCPWPGQISVSPGFALTRRLSSLVTVLFSRDWGACRTAAVILEAQRRDPEEWPTRCPSITSPTPRATSPTTLLIPLPRESRTPQQLFLATATMPSRTPSNPSGRVDANR